MQWDAPRVTLTQKGPGKLDNIGGETLLVVTTARDLALRRAMLNRPPPPSICTTSAFASSRHAPRQCGSGLVDWAREQSCRTFYARATYPALIIRQALSLP